MIALLPADCPVAIARSSRASTLGIDPDCQTALRVHLSPCLETGTATSRPSRIPPATDKLVKRAGPTPAAIARTFAEVLLNFISVVTHHMEPDPLQQQHAFWTQIDEEFGGLGKQRGQPQLTTTREAGPFMPWTSNQFEFVHTQAHLSTKCSATVCDAPTFRWPPPAALSDYTPTATRPIAAITSWAQALLGSPDRLSSPPKETKRLGSPHK